jgi:tetratricopeptide (TPR) repeat protein
LAISSTAEEWEEQGRKLFANKRYRQAKHCFERALRPRQVAMADAYYLRQEARKSPGGNSRRAIDARRAAFLEAAAAFLDCAREDKTFAYFRIAAECFEDAGDDLQAAQAYQDAREFTRSAELWRKLGRFDEAVAIVKAHKKEVRPDVVDKVVNVARLFYFKEQKFEYVFRH